MESIKYLAYKADQEFCKHWEIAWTSFDTSMFDLTLSERQIPKSKLDVRWGTSTFYLSS